MKWLSPPQIGKMLGVDPAKVIGWIRRGELKAVNVSDGSRPRFRIKESDLDAFLERRSAVPTPTKPKRRRRVNVNRSHPNWVTYFE